MLIKNVYIENEQNVCDIRIENGKFAEISQNIASAQGEEIIDMQGCLALPPFVESHVHLDSCLTAGQPRFNMAGTLFEGIAIWGERKESLTQDDVKERVRKTVRMQAENGVQYIRTHVDVTDPSLTAMKAMIELREELKDFIELQIVAFPQEGICSFPNGKELMEEAMKMGADVVGAIPHFEFTREYGVESLNFAVDLAARHNKLVDVHCDEIDDEQARGLEVLAARAYESGLKSRVTASHTTAMHSYNNAYVVKLMRLLKMSEINFVANPLINTHLQGRMDTYPKRRGVTRVKELLEQGINVAFGHDDICDPWYPLGTGNLRDVAFLGLHVCQMMGYEEILNSYKLISTNAAKALNLCDNYGFKVGNDANFLVLEGKNFYEALNKKGEILYSFRKGKPIVKSVPAKREVLF